MLVFLDYTITWYNVASEYGNHGPNINHYLEVATPKSLKKQNMSVVVCNFCTAHPMHFHISIILNRKYIAIWPKLKITIFLYLPGVVTPLALDCIHTNNAQKKHVCVQKLQALVLRPFFGRKQTNIVHLCEAIEQNAITCYNPKNKHIMGRYLLNTNSHHSRHTHLLWNKACIRQSGRS